MTNQFYKMPANILQTECIQKMLKEPGALAQFGLTMLMWLTIQESREKKLSSRVLKNTFAGISSRGQRQRVYDSGFFNFDPETDSYGLDSPKLHAGVHTAVHTGEHAGVHTAVHTAVHPSEHTPVPILLELDKELDIEGEENTRETTSTPTRYVSTFQTVKDWLLNPLH